MLFRLKKTHFVAGFFLSLSALFSPCPGYAAPRYGLWVEAEGVRRPFTDRESFRKFKNFIEENQFTDIYCQVYRGGRSWFPSMFADSAPYQEARAEGLDPLQETLELAHANGVKVHAWVNVLRVFHNPAAPIISVVGKDAVLTDSRGNSLLTYDQSGRPPGKLGELVKLDTPGIWLNAGSPQVRAYLRETVRDLIVAYPTLDGIHLDMIRFPFPMKTAGTGGSFGLGYSEENIRAFHAAYPGQSIAEIPSGALWNAWRRSQVTLMVMEIREVIDELAPHLELSIAGIASVDRAMFSALQDWRGWLQGEIINTVIPMNYNADDGVARTTTEMAVRLAPPGRVLMGVGAWLMLGEPQQAVRQADFSLRQGAGGVVLFSYSNLQNERGRELTQKVGTLFSNPVLHGQRDF